VATDGAAIAVLKVPARHDVHVAAPCGDQVPGLQLAHAVEPNSPAAVPASHSRQADWPVYGLKDPLAHDAHVSALRAATAGELVPTAHRVQAAGPRAVLYVPVEQLAQGPPLGPV